MGTTAHQTAIEDASPTFGRVLTAMVTPFTADGELDQAGAVRLAGWLTRDGHNDGIVVNGTTGESISTTDWEKASMIVAAKKALHGTDRKVLAGVGAADTRHSVLLAKNAAEQGADGLLLVAPYYSRPSQRGLLHHFLTVADSTRLPVMLYDIPKRTGVAIAPETLAEAAKHPRIIAVKDAKGDLEEASWVMRHTDLQYYSGDDALNLPMLSIGATGFVSVVGHLVADRLRLLAEHYAAGRVDLALAVHRELLPIYSGMFRAPAAASVKAALAYLGQPSGPLRSPLIALDRSEFRALLEDLAALDITSRRAA